MVGIASVQGLCMAAYVLTQSVGALELVGITNLDMALGIVYFFYGSAVFIGTPIIGVIFEALGHSYPLIFGFVGIIFGIAGVAAALSYFVKKLC